MILTPPPPDNATISYSSSLIGQSAGDSFLQQPVRIPDMQVSPFQGGASDLTLKELLLTDSSFRDLAAEVIAMGAPDDDEPEGASTEAVGWALELLPKAWVQLGAGWSSPFVSLDGYGGLRMTWNRGRKEVRAVVPADGKRPRYIYFEEENRYGTVPNFTDLTLASYLLKLHQNRPLGEESTK
jgi:hypothetical protein